MPNRKARRLAARGGARVVADPIAALLVLGQQHLAAGRTVDALDAFDQVLTRAPRHAGALYGLGAVAHGAGRFEAARGFFTRAAEAEPGFAPAQIALASLLHADGALAEAATALERALAAGPDDADAWMNLGNIRREQAAFGAAQAAGRRAVELAPDSALAWRNLAVTLQEQGEAPAAIDAYDRALTLDPGFAEAARGRLFCLNYDDTLSAAQITAEHRRWGERAQARAPSPPTAWPNPADPERRLRIGYVSGDFHTHPVGYFLAELLQAHDRRAVEVICYSNGRRVDAMTARLRTVSDHWRDIADLTDPAAEAAIRADGVDVLVAHSGHTSGGRLSLFARRPAPVQAAWLGYVATTGLPAMDYVLTDAETAPPGTEGLFTETVLRSPPGRFCYAPPAYAPEVSPPPSAAGSPVAFGSFNDTLKLNPRTIRLWAAVLAAVPGARLILTWRSLDDSAVRARLAARFAEAGVAAKRLDLRGHSPHADMLAQYADVDIALDPLGFSGGMTSCEALWMGVPVVGLAEEKPASRQTLAFLSRVGLDELIADSEAGYVALAAALAGDPARLTDLRAGLRPRLQASPVRQPAPFTAAHEALIRRMWRTWCAGSRG